VVKYMPFLELYVCPYTSPYTLYTEPGLKSKFARILLLAMKPILHLTILHFDFVPRMDPLLHFSVKKLQTVADHVTLFISQDCAQYYKITGRRVTFEYTLLSGINDSPSHVSASCNLTITSCKPARLCA